jgi:putative spermidine/putrescine transport system substrate-binding protein
VKSLKTPVVLDWDFLSRTHTSDVSTWQVVIPGETSLGTFYAQAINKDSPHPAAARLWEEFLYSATGQNAFLLAGFRPVEMAAMQSAGTLDATGVAALPQALGAPLVMTPAEAVAARVYLAKNWAKAVG